MMLISRSKQNKIKKKVKIMYFYSYKPSISLIKCCNNLSLQIYMHSSLYIFVLLVFKHRKYLINIMNPFNFSDL